MSEQFHSMDFMNSVENFTQESNSNGKRNDYELLVLNILNEDETDHSQFRVQEKEEEGLIEFDYDDLIEKCENEEYECPKHNGSNELLENSLPSNCEKYFICKICNKQFTRHFSLKVHKRIHTGEKPYKCTIDTCTKTYRTSCDLQRHIKVHTGIRPFKCTYENCSFTCSNKANLKVHYRNHTGEKPYKCNFENCNKTFKILTHLQNHCRIHTGEKPYKCEICKNSYTEYSTLYKHKKIHK